MPKYLYPITDPQLMPKQQLLEKSEACLGAGCTLLQYRNKIADYDQCRREAEQLSTLCERYNARLIINDDIELAVAVDAAGVHLGQDDTGITDARTILGQEKTIGATCHGSMELAEIAHEAGANYLAFGRFFPSQTKPDAPPASLDLLKQARKKFSLPLVAIGGINRDNASLLLQAGADYLAVCHELFSLPDGKEIEARIAHYQKLFADCSHTS